MKTEYEAKFLNVDIEEMRKLLKNVGATLRTPMRLMRRVIMENDELINKNAFVRVRDEGDKITITYKQFDSLSIDGAKELEISVNDFDEATALFGAVGLPQISFQESRRETWKYDDIEIVIDEWPWLKPYVEIESVSASKVEEFAIRLGYEWTEAVFGDVMAAYRAEYPHLSETDTIGRLPAVKFDEPLPELLKT